MCVCVCVSSILSLARFLVMGSACAIADASLLMLDAGISVVQQTCATSYPPRVAHSAPMCQQRLAYNRLRAAVPFRGGPVDRHSTQTTGACRECHRARCTHRCRKISTHTHTCPWSTFEASCRQKRDLGSRSSCMATLLGVRHASRLWTRGRPQVRPDSVRGGVNERAQRQRVGQ